MFERLKEHNKIVVVGAQRSGTRIAAKMIAYDTGHEFIDEYDFGFDDRKFRKILDDGKNIVVQAPTMTYLAHTVAHGDTLIVFITRALEDIVASQDRVGWVWNNKKELRNYRKVKGIKKDTVAKLKREFWRNYQKGVIANPMEIPYISLKNHPLWIDKEKRKDFGALQTELK